MLKSDSDRAYSQLVGSIGTAERQKGAQQNLPFNSEQDKPLMLTARVCLTLLPSCDRGCQN